MSHLSNFFGSVSRSNAGIYWVTCICLAAGVYGYLSWSERAPVANPAIETAAQNASNEVPVHPVRVALVIGNGKYRNAPELSNPATDATALGNRLRRLGFVVIAGTDLDRTAMRSKVKEFRTAARGSNIALVFYAGHGLQVSGQNWLLPVDVNLEAPEDLADEAFQADRLLDEMGEVKDLRMLILDACRDNPFKQTITRGLGARSLSVGRGLAQLEPVGASNTLIAYATRANDVAYDGSGTDSPFTTALLEHIEKPMEIRRLFGMVRDTVLAATDRKQEPYIYQSMGGEEIYLVPPSDRKTAAVEVTAPAIIAADQTQQARATATAQPITLASAPADPEIVFWESIKDSSNIDEYKAYLRHYPDGQFLALAQVRINTLENTSRFAKPGSPTRRSPAVSRHKRSQQVFVPGQSSSPVRTEEQIEADQERLEEEAKRAKKLREEREELAEKAEEDRQERIEKAEKAREDALERQEEERERLEEARKEQGR
jgi:hypothetical protein